MNEFIARLRALGFGTDASVNAADAVDVINTYWKRIEAASARLKRQSSTLKANKIYEQALRDEIDEFHANVEKLNARETALRVLLSDLWSFIENVTDETPDHTERFFALRERVRNS
ncbi:hypothetical protein [Telmatospirillum sp.]|uniref:hypothetical protein n=1 Tax=Telmatospirillum sp. TaxID=2079197 RepID=UPI00284AEDA0|nr:hypothetical protein [Telmatospirillum sp.]MDR3436401.1 hypothetical protein [Telmatospirillum sp.]